MKILGLERENYKKFLLEDTKEFPSKMEVLEYLDTLIKISKDLILIRFKGFPTELYRKEEMKQLIMENEYTWVPDNINEIVDTEWNLNFVNDLFIKVNRLKIYPEMLDDIDLISEYLKNNNNEQLRTKIVDYNKNKEMLSIKDNELCQRVIMMADLGLSKEISVLEDKELGKTITHSFLNIKIINNKFIPTMNVIELQKMSPLNVEERIEYTEYYLTLRQLTNLIGKEIVTIELKDKMYTANYNKRDIESKELLYLI